MSRPNPTGSPNGSPSGDLWTRVRSMTASPLLYVGAITVVVGMEVVEFLVGHGIPEFLATLALIPVTLALLYAQLALVAVFGRRRSGRPCA